jgi:hypothetical protein
VEDDQRKSGPAGGSGPDKVAEFLALSAKVSNKAASDAERARWRELRVELAATSAPPPPTLAGQKPRAHPRAKHKLRVHYAPIAELPVTFTDELGGGGLRLRVHQHLEPGTHLLLHLELANAEAVPLTVQAKVVWSRREGGHFAVGVEFVNLPQAEAERLEALLHQK